jgi:ABC-2 type transport system permease protein
MQENLARLSPATLFQEATQAILDPSVRTLNYVTQVLELNQSNGAIPTLLTLDQSLLVIWPQVVALIALTVISFAAAYIAFMRQEVRA